MIGYVGCSIELQRKSKNSFEKWNEFQKNPKKIGILIQEEVNNGFLEEVVNNRFSEEEVNNTVLPVDWSQIEWLVGSICVVRLINIRIGVLRML